ncbi:MAG: HDIG domain-containing protein [Thermoplasmatales archaeon]|nr:HDIG domain-containing protein [Thermoplasmatales archaeon]
MNSIPNPEECIELLKKSGCSEEVISHCKAVRDVAVRMAERANADVKLVEAGALLHDIGRSKTHGIRHLVEGARIAKNLGLPNSIIKIIERHIGAGLPAEDARKLGLPEKKYIPETLEEKIVCHSDNLIDDGEKQTIESEVEKVLAKGLDDYARRLVALHKELSDICGVDVNNI